MQVLKPGAIPVWAACPTVLNHNTNESQFNVSNSIPTGKLQRNLARKGENGMRLALWRNKIYTKSWGFNRS